MICTTCGAENRDTAVSCHTCGMPLPEPVSAESEAASLAAARAAVNAAAQSAKRSPRRINVAPDPKPGTSSRQPSRADVYKQTEFFGEQTGHAHRHAYVGVTAPRTRTLSEEVNESAIMIILALVFFGILGVSGLGVYLNLPDTEANYIRNQFVAYWNGLSTRSEPVPAALVSNPAGAPVPYAPLPAQVPVSTPPALAASPYPAQTMAALDKAIAPSEPVTPEPAVETAPAMPDNEITPIRRPEKSPRPAHRARRANSANNESHTVSFKRFFGPEVERRTYSSESMKLRAQWLWDTEAKILEPDGSINTKYALKPASFSPIPGH